MKVFRDLVLREFPGRPESKDAFLDILGSKYVAFDFRAILKASWHRLEDMQV